MPEQAQSDWGPHRIPRAVLKTNTACSPENKNLNGGRKPGPRFPRTYCKNPDSGKHHELLATQKDQKQHSAHRERFLPEASFRGRQNAKLQYAVLAAAALHGGTEPDLLDEVASWQADDFWQYAMYAAVAYIRAAASLAGLPVRQACQDLDERPGHPVP